MSPASLITMVALFIAGLVFFLFGMNIMSDGLEKLAGGKMEKTLKKMTSNPVKAMGLGAGITAIIQSSSAMTVMLVGLVSSGIMTLRQSIGVIMGSNIGTTITAWIVALAGIEGKDNLLLTIVKPAVFSPFLALLGIAMIMMSKKAKRRDIGTILVAFAVLIFGLEMMGDAVDAIPAERFEAMFQMFNNPLLGLLIGIVVTAIIQSSSASIGILQTIALASGSTLTYGMAIPIIFGQNIGTCVTALIAAVGVNKDGKRVVVVHFASKVIGTIVFMIPYYLLSGLLAEWYGTIASALGIAIIHTVFNVLNTALLLPFCGLLEKFALMVVRDKPSEAPAGYIDELLLKTPSVAVAESKRTAVAMAQNARDSLALATRQFEGLSEADAALIEKNECIVDEFEDNLGSFLVKLSACELSDRDAAGISKLLLSIGDFERLSDHSLMLLRAAQEMKDKNVGFSEQARGELRVIFTAMNEIVRITTEAFETSDLALAKRVEPLEQVIDGLIVQTKESHIERLQKGACTIELGFILNDVLTSCQRVSDHCSNIAVCLIQTKRDAFETHSYLNRVRSGKQSFEDAYAYYASVYHF